MSLLVVAGVGIIIFFWMLVSWVWRSPQEDDSMTDPEGHPFASKHKKET